MIMAMILAMLILTMLSIAQYSGVVIDDADFGTASNDDAYYDNDVQS